jgi:putative addiction module killer protein
MEIRHYLTASGKDPFQEWLDELKDLRGRIVIQRRVDRVAGGNFGDHKFCREGVWELRIDFGPGYRVYYAREEETVVLCFVADQNARNPPTSIKRSVIGSTTNGERDNDPEIKISTIP